MGYLICKNWGLSSFVEGVVRWHHEPNLEKRIKVTSEEGHQVIDLVTFANWVVNDQKFGFSGHQSPDRPSDALLNRLNIHPAQLDLLIQSITSELAMTEDFCGMLEAQAG